ncbi:MAG: recombinase family protein [Acidobacteria bacterium]|nr:recombinase family protein [Acidobacteriota bacterium]
MSQVEHLRDVLSSPPTADYWRRKAEEGWKLAAIEWQREAGDVAGAATEEIPFGLQVAGDGRYLIENPAEMQVLVLIMEFIVQDKRFSQIAAELNRRGFHTRDGSSWSPSAVFNLMPRLIDAGPKIFSSQEWVVRRQRLFHTA